MEKNSGLVQLLNYQVAVDDNIDKTCITGASQISCPCGLKLTNLRWSTHILQIHFEIIHFRIAEPSLSYLGM
jgi:hypothetical protein